MKHDPAGSPPQFEAVILAGGRSSRMGSDKARVRLAGRSMLSWVRTAAEQAGLPCRVVRKDLVPSCGPLGGILTALLSTPAGGCLLLSCDMPFVSARRLQGLVRVAVRLRCSVFTRTGHGVGFPLVILRTDLPLVEESHSRGELSLQRLARKLDAKAVQGIGKQSELMNVNTPGQRDQARLMLTKRSGIIPGLNGIQ